MSFTDLDRFKECVLGALFAECGREGRPNLGTRARLAGLLDAWQVEGPERFRLEQLLEHPVDPFELSIRRSQLRSSLLLRPCRRIMVRLVRSLEEASGCAELTDMASRLRRLLYGVRTDSSLLHRAIRMSLSSRGA